MNLIKIGQFIAKCRKEVNLTQKQLAEKLNITDRAVSKWENGKSLPDSSIMLDLCDILQININDLLKGEIVMDNYDKELEKRLLEVIKEKEEKDKCLLTLEWVIGILSLIIIIVPTFVGAYMPIKEEWIRVVIVFSGFIPGLIGLFFAMKIEQTAGYYECKHCNHKYVPTYSNVFFAPHVGRTRYMKCPKCAKKSWQKKVIKRD